MRGCRLGHAARIVRLCAQAAHVVRTGGNPVPSPRCQAKRGDRIDEIASCRSEKSAEVVQDARVMPW